MSGIEVLEQIRRTDQKTIIIMLTNNASDQHRQRCLKAGANEFLYKSRDFERIPEILQELHQRKNSKHA